MGIADHPDGEPWGLAGERRRVHVDAAPRALEALLQEQEPHLEPGHLGASRAGEVPGLAQEPVQPAVAAHEGVAIDVLEEEQDVLVERERHRARESVRQNRRTVKGSGQSKIMPIQETALTWGRAGRQSGFLYVDRGT